MLDYELLHEYVRTASQQAFAQVVAQHVDAVYSAARRQVREPQLAQDVTQAVFIVLARRARSLVGKGPLIGWLIKTTYFASLDVLKKESRRRRHEREAASMKSTILEPDYATIANEQLSPELDRALARLSDSDRTLIALRYLESRSIIEVGRAAGISPEAAAKRISRAMVKLREILVQRDAFPAAVPIAAVLEHLTREHAPEMLAKAIAAGASGTASANVAAISKGVIQMIIWKKATVAAAVIAVVLLAAGTGVGTISLMHSRTTQTVPSAPVHSIAVNPDVAAASPVVAALSNGISIEIIGLSEHPSAGKQWWRADGTLLAEAPYRRVNAQVSTSEPEMVAREVALRLNKTIRGMQKPSTVRWSMIGANFSGGGPVYDTSRRMIDNMEGLVVVVPDSSTGAVLRADIASGPWQPVGEIDAGVGKSSMIEAAQYTITSLSSLAGSTRVQFSQSRSQLGTVDSQWIAVDAQGQEHRAHLGSMQYDPAGIRGEIVAEVPVESLQRLILQNRPYDQWITIRNIAMHPGQLTHLEIATSDDKLLLPKKAE